jgi:hypothetical protein
VFSCTSKISFNDHCVKGHYTLNCIFKVSVAVRKKMASPACPVEEREKCKTKTVYESCRNVAFGFEGWKTKRTSECGSDEMKVTEPGLSAKELPKELISKYCSTCDGPVENTSAGWSERASCLIDALQSVAGGIYSEATAQKIVNASHGLVEAAESGGISIDDSVVNALKGTLSSLTE